jgi:hypothetical protein
MSIGLHSLVNIELLPETSEHYHFKLTANTCIFFVWGKGQEKTFEVYCEKDDYSWFYEKYSDQWFSGQNINVCGGAIRAMLLEKLEAA